MKLTFQCTRTAERVESPMAVGQPSEGAEAGR